MEQRAKNYFRFLPAIILLACVLLPVAFRCWIGGMVMGLAALFLDYQYKLKKMALRENLPGAVSFSVMGCNLHWQPRNDSKTKNFDSEIIRPSLVGTIFAVAIAYLCETMSYDVLRPPCALRPRMPFLTRS